MEIAEKFELGLIIIVAIGIRAAGILLPDQIRLGSLLLGASALLLFQSLIRDLWLLAKARRTAATIPPRRVARCMCVESTMGISGVAIGLITLACGIGTQVSMGKWCWSGIALLVFGTGFLIKDYVLESNPFRIRRDKDHVNIIVRWKKQV